MGLLFPLAVEGLAVANVGLKRLQVCQHLYYSLTIGATHLFNQLVKMQRQYKLGDA